MGDIVSFIAIIAGWASHAVRGVQEARELVKWASDKIKVMVEEQRDPTEAEWAELNAKTDALRALLHSDTA